MTQDINLYRVPADLDDLLQISLEPCIQGVRITVYDGLSYLASGMTYAEILKDFPYLTQEDIFACLSYAADREHQILLV